MKKKNNFKIRKANLKDLDDVLALNFKLFKKEYREYDKTLNLEWTHNRGKKYFFDKIKKGEGFVEVIEHENKIIGYLCGGILKRKNSRIKAKYGSLDNMFIEKKYRNQGLGFRLVGDFIVWSRKKHIDYIKITSSAANKFAHKFYKRIGFKDLDVVFQMKLK